MSQRHSPQGPANVSLTFVMQSKQLSPDSLVFLEQLCTLISNMTRSEKVTTMHLRVALFIFIFRQERVLLLSPLPSYCYRHSVVCELLMLTMVVRVFYSVNMQTDTTPSFPGTVLVVLSGEITFTP